MSLFKIIIKDEASLNMDIVIRINSRRYQSYEDKWSVIKLEHAEKDEYLFPRKRALEILQSLKVDSIYNNKKVYLQVE